MYLNFSICPPIGSHIPFSGRLCMPEPSICFWTLRLLLSQPGSFKSLHERKCICTQSRPWFNVSSEGRGVTFASNTQLPYLHYQSRDSKLGLLEWEASVLPIDQGGFLKCLNLPFPPYCRACEGCKVQAVPRLQQAERRAL